MSSKEPLLEDSCDDRLRESAFYVLEAFEGRCPQTSPKAHWQFSVYLFVRTSKIVGFFKALSLVILYYLDLCLYLPFQIRFIEYLFYEVAQSGIRLCSNVETF